MKNFIAFVQYCTYFIRVARSRFVFDYKCCTFSVLQRFQFHFWLSHNLVYLLYFCPSL